MSLGGVYEALYAFEKKEKVYVGYMNMIIILILPWRCKINQ
jgi:hypothetical protein